MKCALIVFVKNPVLGNVKTRLAADIGDKAALPVHIELMHITERATSDLKECDVLVYFSDKKDTKYWPAAQQYVQVPGDLGTRMSAAFAEAFRVGYDKVVGIGSDLPDLTADIIESAFRALDSSDLVFGPASDGGYYIYGMKQFEPIVFTDKPWSTERLLALTLDQLEAAQKTVTLLEEHNDIDTAADLESSSLRKV